jgi:hypothetical protein
MGAQMPRTDISKEHTGFERVDAHWGIQRLQPCVLGTQCLSRRVWTKQGLPSLGHEEHARPR